MTGENEYSPLMTRISRRGGVPPPLPSKNFLQNFSPSAKFPQFFFAFGEMFEMLNDRSNSEKSLNDQDLQEGGRTPPYPIKSMIFLMTNMRCIFEIIKFIRPMDWGQLGHSPPKSLGSAVLSVSTRGISDPTPPPPPSTQKKSMI